MHWDESVSNAPYFSMTNFKVPPGSPIFQKGYSDGCVTALYSRGNYFYRAKYNGPKYDSALIDNSKYRFGHSRGYSYCFAAIISPTSGRRGSFDKTLFPYKQANGSADYGLDSNAASWNNVWGTGAFNDNANSPLGGSVTGNGFNGIFQVLQGNSNEGVFSGDPLYSGGSKGQFFGQ